jgi:hypothetical protein
LVEPLKVPTVKCEGVKLSDKDERVPVTCFSMSTLRIQIFLKIGVCDDAGPTVGTPDGQTHHGEQARMSISRNVALWSTKEQRFELE